jgi:hypothetical protein
MLFQEPKDNKIEARLILTRLILELPWVPRFWAATLRLWTICVHQQIKREEIREVR